MLQGAQEIEAKKTLSDYGYSWAYLKGLRQKPTVKFYKLENGNIVEMELPSQEPFLRRYLSRGFVLDRAILEKQVKQESEKNVKFECQICGKVCQNAIGLEGHKRSHKN